MTKSHADNTVVLGSSDPVSQAVAWAVGAPVADAYAPITTEPDGVVIVVGVAPNPQPTSASSLDEAGWHRLAEEPMRRTLVALQRAHSAMSVRGGRIVVVVPTIGISGSARLVPYTTVLEGTRAMVKSAARQWSSTGIGVNTVAAPLSLFVPAASGFGGHLTAAAVAEDGTMIDTVMEAVLFLLRPDVKHLAGATIVADGGSVMLP